MEGLWIDLYDKNKERYARARPKRGQYIYEYLEKKGGLSDVDNASFLELGAFSAKDSVFLQKKLPLCTFYVSDLEPEILQSHASLTAFAGDIFQIPLREKSVDYSFHSGLIVLFKNSDVEQIIKNQIGVTKRISFIFGLNAYNFIDHFLCFWRYRLKKNKLYNYRRFSRKELATLTEGLVGVDIKIYYYDNMVENVASRIGWGTLKKMSKTILFRAPIFYNEVVLVIETKCAG